MPQGETLRIQGYREFTRAMNRAPATLKREWREGRRRIAEPTRQLAASRALSEIRQMPRSVSWSAMRTGATTYGIYVAPKKRGVKSRGGSRKRRPNLAGLLMDRAMLPALRYQEGQILRDVDRLLADMGREWER